jgi:hypothetical protein
MKTKLITLLSLFIFIVNAFPQGYKYDRVLNYDLSNKPDSVKKYFDEVCVASRTSSLFRYCRWEKDVYIFLCVEDSTIKDSIINEVKNLIVELNSIINPINIYLTEDISKMTTFAVVGSFDYFNEMSLKYNQKWKLYDDGKTGGVNNPMNNMENIYYSYFFVNSPKTNSYGYRFTKHVLIEEMTQSFGINNDSWEYSDSIFYDGFNPYYCPTKLSELDKEVINILYNENVK